MNTFQKFSTLKNKYFVYFLIILLLLLIFFILSLCVGTFFVFPSKVICGLFSMKDLSLHNILYFIRLPRSLGAMLCGASLATSGLILQTVLQNGLCGPNIIGINSSAGFFYLLAIVFFPKLQRVSFVFSFFGAIICALIIFLLSKFSNSSKSVIILSGVALSSLFGAFIDTLLVIYPDLSASRIGFMIGSFANITYEKLGFAFFIFIAVIAFLLIFSYEMNLFCLGSEKSATLGFSYKLFSFLFLATAAALSGLSVSLAGLLGFIGLIIPHIFKLLLENDFRILLPFCILGGALFSLICDILARTLFLPFEIPCGIIFSFLGVPFFIYLIIWRKKGVFYD